MKLEEKTDSWLRRNAVSKNLIKLILPSLLLSLLTSTGVYNFSRNVILNNAEKQFNNDSLQVVSQINNEFGRYKELLYSTTAFVSSIDKIKQADVKKYLNQLNLDKYPALYSFNYIEPVAHKNLKPFYDNLHSRYSDKSKDFQEKFSEQINKNLRNTLRHNNEHYVMSLFEPIEKGSDLIGTVYDDDPLMIKTILDGKNKEEITYTGQYYLENDDNEGRYLVSHLRFPAYSNPKDISSFKGSVGLGIKLNKDLFQYANKDFSYVNFQIFDSSLKNGNILYDSRTGNTSLPSTVDNFIDKDKQESILKKSVALNLFNKNLEVHIFTSNVPPNIVPLGLANVIFAITFFISFFIFFLIYSKWHSVYLDKRRVIEEIEELKKVAYGDSITKLPNKKSFEKDLNIFIKDSNNVKAYLLFLTLDGFKRINEIMGIGLGDLILQQFASKLQLLSGTEEFLVYKFSGHHFAIFIEDNKNMLTNEDIETLTNKILKINNDLSIANGEKIPLSLNVGISQYPIDGNNAEELFKNSDLAVYDARKKGRNTYSFYSEEFGTAVKRKTAIEQNILNVLERKELYLMFQPKVQYINNEFKFVGAEVLLRWKNEKLGEVSPVEFIPIAEESGMMPQIGLWVFEQTVKYLAKWNESSLEKIKMSVNLSVHQLANPNIINDFITILKAYNVSTEQIIIEITESTMMKDVESSHSVLKEFSDNGFAISIDDFGTGYSALSYLKKFSIDEIKIDRSFTKDVLCNHKDKIVIAGIINLAQNLGLNVVVEGVESKEQLDWFQEKGRVQVQGFYFSKPLLEEDFINYWKKAN